MTNAATTNTLSGGFFKWACGTMMVIAHVGGDTYTVSQMARCYSSSRLELQLLATFAADSVSDGWGYESRGLETIGHPVGLALKAEREAYCASVQARPLEMSDRRKSVPAPTPVNLESSLELRPLDMD